MKNFNLQVSPKQIREHVYHISRSSDVYSFFSCEYHQLVEDGFGNIMVPGDVNLGSGFVRSIMDSLKGRIFRKDFSISIPAGSREHSYFASEYQHSFMEDARHNIIVPGEEVRKVR